MNAVLNVGARVLLTDGREGVVQGFQIDHYGRLQHDVWVRVSVEQGREISVSIDAIEERLPDD